MFKLKCDGKILSDIVSMSRPLVSEVKLVLNKDGLTCRAVDPAHVAMLDIELKKDAFQEWECKGEDNLELGIDMDKLGGIMRLSASGDIVTLEHDEETNRLVVKIGNLVRKMALIDTAGMPDPKIPTLDLPGLVILEKTEITKAVKGAESITDHIKMTVTEDGFELFGEGDTDSITLKLDKSSVEELQAKVKAASMFSIDYFSNCIKNATKNISLYIGNDNPIKISYDFAESKGHITYLLAPRIESE